MHPGLSNQDHNGRTLGLRQLASSSLRNADRIPATHNPNRIVIILQQRFVADMLESLLGQVTRPSTAAATYAAGLATA